MEQRTFGLRQLLSTVNLKDFSHMIGGELGLIGASVRLAFQSLLRPPFGPLMFLVAMLLAVLRSMLLALVVVAFGAAILIVTIVRSAAGLLRGRGEGS